MKLWGNLTHKCTNTFKWRISGQLGYCIPERYIITNVWSLKAQHESFTKLTQRENGHIERNCHTHQKVPNFLTIFYFQRLPSSLPLFRKETTFSHARLPTLTSRTTNFPNLSRKCSSRTGFRFSPASASSVG